MRNIRSQGFTLIELVVVIVILGILAASAAPKFMSLKSDARRSTLQAFAGALKSTNDMYHAKAIAQGLTGNTDSWTDNIFVEINGVQYHLKYGYVDRNNISYLVDGTSAIPPSSGKATSRTNGLNCKNLKTKCEYDWCDCYPDDLRDPVFNNASDKTTQIFIPNGYVPANYKNDKCYVAYKSANKPKNSPVNPPMIKVFADNC